LGIWGQLSVALDHGPSEQCVEGIQFVRRKARLAIKLHGPKRTQATRFAEAALGELERQFGWDSKVMGGRNLCRKRIAFSYRFHGLTVADRCAFVVPV
jgi:hypothetical protein